MTEESRSESTFGCLLQLFWTLVGPGLLLAAGALLVVNQPKLGSPPDFVFVGLAVLVGAARLLDRRPATGSRLMYLGILAAGVVMVLLLSHVVGLWFS